ncbi:MAG TPA: glutathione S-transferase family protein, partial [Thermoleophilaceae bacterium]|nr:glutathione S-transferase family protein [Thermoleophilaceae bacterium]
MADNTLSILTPSVNNLTARVFVRAAGLEFEERDVWGKKDEPDFVRMDPAQLTPMLEEEGLPRGSLWESCAIMQYLCNKHGLDHLYPTDPGERAMTDSAMFYLTGTLYPLVAR